MRGDDDYRNYRKISYPQPYNIRIPPCLDFCNSALTEHIIIKSHVAAKHEAKRIARESQRRYYRYT
jgi:hypothetical protein